MRKVRQCSWYQTKPCLRARDSFFTRTCTVRELQQFLAGSNWLRNYVIDYARIFQPLQVLLLSHTTEAGTLKGSKLSKLPLKFTDEDKSNFENCKSALQNCAQMASPRKGYRLQLLTDASDLSWSIVLTQVTEQDLNIPVQDRFHEPLGLFGFIIRVSLSI